MRDIKLVKPKKGTANGDYRQTLNPKPPLFPALLPVAVKVTSLWRITSNIFSSGKSDFRAPCTEIAQGLSLGVESLEGFRV